MTTILRIDASSRNADGGSVSRAISDRIEKALAARPGTSVMRRDLATMPLPHIAAKTIAGFFTPDPEMTEELRTATALSDQLITELKSADILVLTVPMYNFSIPSALKAWIDQIIRIGHTFAFDGTSFTGLLTGKKAYVACSYGASGYASGQPFAAANFVEPYLRFLLGFLGIADVMFFSVEATTGGEDATRVNKNAAMMAVDIALAA